MRTAWIRQGRDWRIVGKVLQIRGTKKHARADIDLIVEIRSRKYNYGEWDGTYQYLYTKEVWTNTGPDRLHGWRSAGFKGARLCITPDGQPPAV